MKNHCKQKELTSISLKFKTPQCVNLYRKVICPDQWSLILSQTLQTLRIKTQKEDLFFKKTELEEGKILELNITTKSKIAQNSSNGNETPKTKASCYALRVPINQITEIKINNEEYWDPENHTFTKELQGKE